MTTARRRAENQKRVELFSEKEFKDLEVETGSTM